MFDDDSIRFKVVANHQEQYSIWPDFKEIPEGWIAVGTKGTREQCLDYIEKVWTDMRPKRLRDKMKTQDAAPTPTEATQAAAAAVTNQHTNEVEEYGAGKPELYGWFVAKVLDTNPDLPADEVRNALDAMLPAHNIPDHYA